jgi:Ni2+-binding GTPase involved in maturation of urease and hydrogenase
MLALCMALRDEYSIAAVTNDIFTRSVSFPFPVLLKGIKI